MTKEENVCQEFSKRKWFNVLFGFDENIKSIKNNFEINKFEDHIELKSKINSKSFNAGIFEMKSSDMFQKNIERKNGKLNIIHGYGSHSKRYELVDILSMQSLPEWDGATYLAASNFNCLEFVCCEQTAEDGVTNYYADITQGPYAALACAPSIVYRNYFLEHGDKNCGQLEKEINLLERTKINVVHGYAKIDDDNELKKLDIQWTDPHLWQIGIHKNCQVVITRGPNGKFALSPPGHIAHHVYAAAFNFSSDVIETNFTKKLAKNLLTAEYRATIMAAWDNSISYPLHQGSNKLSLTLLGGGVFENPYEIICESIAENAQLIIDSGLDVYLTCFDDYTFQTVYPLLREVINKTNGEIIDANK